MTVTLFCVDVDEEAGPLKVHAYVAPVTPGFAINKAPSCAHVVAGAEIPDAIAGSTVTVATLDVKVPQGEVGALTNTRYWRVALSTPVLYVN